VYAVDYNPDDTVVRLGMLDQNPSVITYTIDGDVFSGTTDPAISSPGLRTFGIAHSPSGGHLALGGNNSPFVKLYAAIPTLPDINVDANNLTDAFIKTGL